LERKLKAVIDTNLFISGLFAKDSLSAQLQDRWINRDFELITSIEIIYFQCVYVEGICNIERAFSVPIYSSYCNLPIVEIGDDIIRVSHCF